MIVTLSVTILIESIIVIGYCFWRKKPLLSILSTSILGNLITQSLLWVVLTLFFQQYLASLLIAEISIWAIESLLLFAVPSNRLRLTEAVLLSLSMNLVSFALGLFLPT